MTKVKICGITSMEDYDTVNRLGADYTGFIFYEKSPRYIAPSKAAEINTPDRKSLRVGVFVNEDHDVVKRIFKTAKLDLVQLHGEESPGYCRKLDLPFIKVFRTDSPEGIADISRYDTKYILIDTLVKGKYGGTGKTMDTEVLGEIIVRAEESGRKVFAAGGLSPENIGEILALKPYAVDINSGVESAPGVKDKSKLTKIFEKIKRSGTEA